MNTTVEMLKTMLDSAVNDKLEAFRLSLCDRNPHYFLYYSKCPGLTHNVHSLSLFNSSTQRSATVTLAELDLVFSGPGGEPDKLLYDLRSPKKNKSLFDLVAKSLDEQTTTP